MKRALENGFLANCHQIFTDKIIMQQDKGWWKLDGADNQENWRGGFCKHFGRDFFSDRLRYENLNIEN